MSYGVKEVYRIPGLPVLPFSEAEEEGKWITIRGTHVLIKDGESVGDAFKRTTGKELTQFEKDLYQKRIDTDNQPKDTRSAYQKQVDYTQRQKDLADKWYEEHGEGPEEGYDEHGNIILPRSQTPKTVGFEPTEDNLRAHYSKLSQANQSIVKYNLSWDESKRLDAAINGGKASRGDLEKWLNILKKRENFVWQP